MGYFVATVHGHIQGIESILPLGINDTQYNVWHNGNVVKPIIWPLFSNTYSFYVNEGDLIEWDSDGIGLVFTPYRRLTELEKHIWKDRHSKVEFGNGGYGYVSYPPIPDLIIDKDNSISL